VRQVVCRGGREGEGAQSRSSSISGRGGLNEKNFEIKTERKKQYVTQAGWAPAAPRRGEAI